MKLVNRTPLRSLLGAMGRLGASVLVLLGVPLAAGEPDGSEGSETESVVDRVESLRGELQGRNSGESGSVTGGDNPGHGSNALWDDWNDWDDWDNWEDTR